MTDERKNLPSASGIERLALCPGSFAAEAQAPKDERNSPDAQSGERIHAALAGEIMEATLPEEEQQVVQRCRRLVADLAASTYGAIEHADTVELEQRHWLRVGGKPIISGKADLIAIYGMRLLVVDYKSGRGDVTAAASNFQLRALVAIIAANYPIKEATVAIIQPYGETPVSTCWYNDDDIAQARDEVISVVATSQGHDAPRIPSEKACKYCRAKAICPEAREQSLALAETGPTAVMEPEAAALTLTEDQLSTFLDRAAFAERVIEACRDEAKRRLTNGVDLHGWKLKPGTERETITNPQTVYDRFCDIGGNGEQFLECVSITKGKLKDAVKAITTARGKALDAAMASMLAGCVETKTSSPSLIKA